MGAQAAAVMDSSSAARGCTMCCALRRHHGCCIGVLVEPRHVGQECRQANVERSYREFVLCLPSYILSTVKALIRDILSEGLQMSVAMFGNTIVV